MLNETILAAEQIRHICRPSGDVLALDQVTLQLSRSRSPV
jgi:hypothetical protein